MIGNALILGRTNGVGLDRDAQLLADALADAGISSSAPKIRGLRALLFPAKPANLAFHLERVFPLWKRKATTHFLIPNQERFPERHLKRLRHIDHILCKSRHAAEIFAHHSSVHYIGFTSPDRLLPEIEPDYTRFLHLAGRSTLKNTGLLLELWAKHPEWPTLTLIQHPDNAPKSVPANVELISQYLPDSALQNLQNRIGLHLCPSLSEGWGHYIAEAASCRAVILTTDAPPMNELIRPDRGTLVPTHRSEPRHLGQNFYADPEKLETAIQNLLSLNLSEKLNLAQSARHWFEENDRQFRENLSQTLARLIHREKPKCCQKP